MVKETNTTHEAVLLQTRNDMKNALFAVSITANLFIFTAWLVVMADPTVAVALVSLK